MAALIISAVHRISKHTLTNQWLWGIGIFSFTASLLNIHFIITLLVSGFIYILHIRRQNVLAATAGIIVLLGAVVYYFHLMGISQLNPDIIANNSAIIKPSILTLFYSGLRGGLLTFGGYLGGGPLGAIVITVGIFLPAFAFTLIGHDYFEKVMGNQTLANFLDGVTAGVVGMIAATSIRIFYATISDIPKFLIFAASLVVLYKWKVKTVTLWVIVGAGLVGYLVQYVQTL